MLLLAHLKHKSLYIGSAADPSLCLNGVLSCNLGLTKAVRCTVDGILCSGRTSAYLKHCHDDDASSDPFTLKRVLRTEIVPLLRKCPSGGTKKIFNFFGLYPRYQSMLPLMLSPQCQSDPLTSSFHSRSFGFGLGRDPGVKTQNS